MLVQGGRGCNDLSPTARPLDPAPPRPTGVAVLHAAPASHRRTAACARRPVPARAPGRVGGALVAALPAWLLSALLACLACLPLCRLSPELRVPLLCTLHPAVRTYRCRRPCRSWAAATYPPTLPKRCAPCSRRVLGGGGWAGLGLACGWGCGPPAAQLQGRSASPSAGVPASTPCPAVQLSVLKLSDCLLEAVAAVPWHQVRRLLTLWLAGWGAGHSREWAAGTPLACAV